MRKLEIRGSGANRNWAVADGDFTVMFYPAGGDIRNLEHGLNNIDLMWAKRFSDNRLAPGVWPRETQSMNTPWGPSQCVTTYAPGISLCETAGHGGFHLDLPELCELRAQFPGFKLFGGVAQWFEEDCDSVLVVLAFHECFGAFSVYGALRHYQLSDYFAKPAGEREKWLKSVPGRLVAARVAQWEKENAENWIAGSSFTKDGKWSVSFRQVGTNARREVLMHEYPGNAMYSTEQLDSVDAMAVGTTSPRLEFREEECGGVFDGVGSVTSDADPGL